MFHTQESTHDAYLTTFMDQDCYTETIKAWAIILRPV